MMALAATTSGTATLTQAASVTLASLGLTAASVSVQGCQLCALEAACVMKGTGRCLVLLPRWVLVGSLSSFFLCPDSSASLTCAPHSTLPRVCSPPCRSVSLGRQPLHRGPATTHLLPHSVLHWHCSGRQEHHPEVWRQEDCAAVFCQWSPQQQQLHQLAGQSASYQRHHQHLHCCHSRQHLHPRLCHWIFPGSGCHQQPGIL